MKVEVQITVDIIDIKEIRKKAIQNKHPAHLIKMYGKMIEDKQDELRMLQFVEAI